MTKPLTIAIDGHSSTGKSTLAKALAKSMGYVYVDSGAMYRAVALFALRKGWVSKENGCDAVAIESTLDQVQITFELDAAGVNATFLNGQRVEEEIREMAVSHVVSHVAKLSEVRRYLVALQQAMGRNGGVVMDGRDIGTVVFPNAELKIFMTASDDVRAARRKAELDFKGQDVTFQEVLENLKSRDKADMERSDSPLIAAEDARTLDNSTMNREDQFELVLDWTQSLLV
ncbi:MAG: (d)CMP kinase [Schleiferiaceae bacterium]|jgi:cytidylate kinase|nr:(d)CMP kinase [Schleiferiaceae bacterium]MDG1313053.1 (d)CMP kinase [Schleiferiaceae bacterium]MDG1919051.1 (d)CMP kinase [Schleiferiaceae bacterium]MDG2110179.1 (d)CMP kinase [Schleiferiaceae bacterium]